MSVCVEDNQGGKHYVRSRERLEAEMSNARQRAAQERQGSATQQTTPQEASQAPTSASTSRPSPIATPRPPQPHTTPTPRTTPRPPQAAPAPSRMQQPAQHIDPHQVSVEKNLEFVGNCIGASDEIVRNFPPQLKAKLEEIKKGERDAGALLHLTYREAGESAKDNVLGYRAVDNTGQSPYHTDQGRTYYSAHKGINRLYGNPGDAVKFGLRHSVSMRDVEGQPTLTYNYSSVLNTVDSAGRQGAKFGVNVEADQELTDTLRANPQAVPLFFAAAATYATHDMKGYTADIPSMMAAKVGNTPRAPQMLADDTVVFFDETQPGNLSFQAFSVSKSSNTHQPKEMPVLDVALNDKPVLTPLAGGRPPMERRFAKEFNEGNVSGILYEGKQGRLQLGQEQR